MVFGTEEDEELIELLEDLITDMEKEIENETRFAGLEGVIRSLERVYQFEKESRNRQCITIFCLAMGGFVGVGFGHYGEELTRVCSILIAAASVVPEVFHKSRKII